MDYRYSLMKGSKKFMCPGCGRKSVFVPYVDEANHIVDVEKYGRCERINSCGYIRYPDMKPNEWIRKEPIYIHPKPIDFVSEKIVEKTFNNFKENVFFQYLIKTFGKEIAFELQSHYNIGTTKNGGTIFWQQDRKNRFRTGKVINYKLDGHRDKEKPSWFVHRKIKEDFNYQQCFFGLHLVSVEKPIALCESEKTAIMMSVYEPDFTWVASGGSEMLNIQRLSELPRLDKVFADNGQFEKWAKATRNFDGRQMDVSVDKAVSDGFLEKGSDILDLYMLNKK